jgi:hypothetical protein
MPALTCMLALPFMTLYTLVAFGIKVVCAPPSGNLQWTYSTLLDYIVACRIERNLCFECCMGRCSTCFQSLDMAK